MRILCHYVALAFFGLYAAFCFASPSTPVDLEEGGSCDEESNAQQCKLSSNVMNSSTTCTVPSNNNRPKNLVEFREKFNCDSMYDTERPIISQTTWESIRNVYLEVAGISDASSFSNRRGLHPAIKPGQAGYKGRGLFATAPIKKGEVLWESTRTRPFHDTDTLHRFLEAIDQDYVCDLTEWIFMMKKNPDIEDEDIEELEGERSYDFHPDVFILCIDMDDGSLVNQAENDDEVNMRGVTMGGCNNISYASRDIEEGEELLEDFESDEGYPYNSYTL